jgi:hypothetical protein
VAEAARLFKPSVVFLDFDGTLCNTKAGLRPQAGKHGVNPALLELLMQACRPSRQSAIVGDTMSAPEMSPHAHSAGPSPQPAIALGSSAEQSGLRVWIVSRQNFKHSGFLREFLIAAGVPPASLFESSVTLGSKSHAAEDISADAAVTPAASAAVVSHASRHGIGRCPS